MKRNWIDAVAYACFSGTCIFMFALSGGPICILYVAWAIWLAAESAFALDLT